MKFHMIDEIAQRLSLQVAGCHLVTEGRPLTCAEMDALWEACRPVAPRPTERGAFKVRQVLIARLPRVPSIGHDFEPTVLDAYDLDAVQCAAWCPHCRYWHLHGVPSRGHRSSHCHVQPDPYPVGYTLRDCGPASTEIKRDVLRRKQMWVP